MNEAERLEKCKLYQRQKAAERRAAELCVTCPDDPPPNHAEPGHRCADCRAAGRVKKSPNVKRSAGYEKLLELNLMGVARAACRRRGIDLDALFDGPRQPHIIDARVEVWQELRGRGWSYPAIAEAWGVDHTTVLSAMRLREQRGEKRRNEAGWQFLEASGEAWVMG